MSVRSKAIVETAKVFAAYAIGGVVFYFLLEILGPKLGMWLLVASMSSWFAWLIYDYYVHKFTYEEKLKD